VKLLKLKKINGCWRGIYKMDKILDWCRKREIDPDELTKKEKEKILFSWFGFGDEAMGRERLANLFYDKKMLKNMKFGEGEEDWEYFKQSVLRQIEMFNQAKREIGLVEEEVMPSQYKNFIESIGGEVV